MLKKKKPSPHNGPETYQEVRQHRLQKLWVERFIDSAIFFSSIFIGEIGHLQPGRVNRLIAQR